MSNTTDPLIWIDCELTSLDFTSNKIVEIACVVTDADLEVLGTPVSFVIGFDANQLDPLLSDWTREHFTESGLIEEILQSTITMEQAETQILEYVSKYCRPQTSPLCGNSVGQDRRALYTNMPKLEEYLHYRTVDVSTLKELSLRWNPDVLKHIIKAKTHRALDDIIESIEELRQYKKHFLRAQ